MYIYILRKLRTKYASITKLAKFKCEIYEISPLPSICQNHELTSENIDNVTIRNIFCKWRQHIYYYITVFWKRRTAPLLLYYYILKMKMTHLILSNYISILKMKIAPQLLYYCICFLWNWRGRVWYYSTIFLFWKWYYTIIFWKWR